MLAKCNCVERMPWYKILPLHYNQLAQFLHHKNRPAGFTALWTLLHWLKKSLIKSFCYYKTRFPNLSTNNIWGEIILCYGVILCIVGCWEISTVSTYYYMLVTPYPHVTKIISRHCQMPFGGQNCPWLRTTFSSASLPTESAFIY